MNSIGKHWESFSRSTGKFERSWAKGDKERPGKRWKREQLTLPECQDYVSEPSKPSEESASVAERAPQNFWRLTIVAGLGQALSTEELEGLEEMLGFVLSLRAWKTNFVYASCAPIATPVSQSTNSVRTRKET